MTRTPIDKIGGTIWEYLKKLADETSLMTNEVDGWKYHIRSEIQRTRDYLKDEILSKYGLKPYRISTTDTINIETMADILDNALYSRHS